MSMSKLLDISREKLQLIIKDKEYSDVEQNGYDLSKEISASINEDTKDALGIKCMRHISKLSLSNDCLLIYNWTA